MKFNDTRRKSGEHEQHTKGSFPLWAKLVALVLVIVMLLPPISMGIASVFPKKETGGAATTTSSTKQPQKKYSPAFLAAIGDRSVPEVEPGPVYRTIDEWYSMEELGGEGYLVGPISDGFKAAIQNETEFIDSDGNCWRPGDPLPNPGYTYMDKPVSGAVGTFTDLDTNLALDLTLWDCNNWVYFNNLFANCNIAEVNLSGCDLHYVNYALTLFWNCSVGKIYMRGINLKWAGQTPADIGLFTQSTIGYLDIRGMTFHKLDSLFANCRIGALNAANCNVEMVISAKRMFKGSEIHALDLSNWRIINLHEMEGFLEGASIGDEYQADGALLSLLERWPNQEWLAFEELAAPVLDLSTWRGRTDTLATAEYSPKNEVQIILPARDP